MAFNFVDSYRKLQPAAETDVVAKRNASFEGIKKALSDQRTRILDAARFAYRVNHPAGSDADAWLDGLMKANDPVFSIGFDREEAARMCTLALEDRLGGSFYGTPVAVVTAAFTGKRATVDKGKLSVSATATVERLARVRGLIPPPVTIIAPAVTQLAEVAKQLEDETIAPNQAMPLIAKDYHAQIRKLTDSANAAMVGMTEQVRRLSEETDLLWWHIGGHSYLLNSNLAALPELARPIVIGMDVASMVTALPGPYGVYGIIRKALAGYVNTEIKLADAVKALKDEQPERLSETVSDHALLPVHSAVAAVAAGSPYTAESFEKATGLSYNVKMSQFELALQAYHERLLLKMDWTK